MPLSTVIGLFRATQVRIPGSMLIQMGAKIVLQQTQSNFEEMLSLSVTAGRCALNIVERCSTIEEMPTDLDDAIKKLERFVE